jgi:transposase-like protein/predicted RNA-binding Zn-ribbon protein involved in translation (DUF1610 family)
MEFEPRFPTEASCRDYLAKLRWPDGFRCPHCGTRSAWQDSRTRLICRACRRQIRLTAGTIFQDSHLPLRVWFKAIWWVTSQKAGGSAAGLQAALGLGSYRTAWLTLHKLRRAMVRPGREPLTGPVEVDDAFIGGVEPGVKGRETLKKAKIVVAVEVPGGRLGRVRLQHVRSFSPSSLLPFIQTYVTPGSRILTDGWQGYDLLQAQGYRHRRRVPPAGTPNRLLPHVHLIISLLKRWLLGTHQGRVAPKHLQEYLDEFAFRCNRRTSRHRGQLFYRVLQHAVRVRPTSYRQIVNPTLRDHKR